jgi:hypothetical protein
MMRKTTKLSLAFGAIIIALLFGSKLIEIGKEASKRHEQAVAEKKQKDAERNAEIQKVNELVNLVESSPDKCESLLNGKMLDTWGTPYKVVFDKGVKDSVVVISNGPDKEWPTPDDISARVTSINFRKVGEVVGSSVGEFTTGAYKSLKDKIFEEKKNE